MKRGLCEWTETGRLSSLHQRCSASSRAAARTRSASTGSSSCAATPTTVCADALHCCSACCSWWVSVRGFILLNYSVTCQMMSASLRVAGCRCWRPECLKWRTSRTCGMFTITCGRMTLSWKPLHISPGQHITAGINEYSNKCNALANVIVKCHPSKFIGP